MRILKADAFLALPENTVYAMFAHGQMGPLCIKGTTNAALRQFLYSEISVAIVRHIGTDPLTSLALAHETGEAIEMDFETMNLEREVMDKQLFMVWDRTDVVGLVRRLVDCLAHVPERAEAW